MVELVARFSRSNGPDIELLDSLFGRDLIKNDTQWIPRASL